VGRVITQDIQRHFKRAEYGERLLEALGARLTKQYGNGFSARSLWDMRRFFTEFAILPPPVAELGERKILPPVAAESAESEICSAVSSKFSAIEIRQPLAEESSASPIRATAAAKSEDRLTVDFAKHSHLGWTHYRILLTVEAVLKIPPGQTAARTKSLSPTRTTSGTVSL